MRILAHPLRLDAAGQFATVEQWSPAAAAQAALVVVSVPVGERPLAPLFGLQTTLLGRRAAVSEVVAALEVSEPDLMLIDGQVTGPGTDARERIDVVVQWREDDETEG